MRKQLPPPPPIPPQMRRPGWYLPSAVIAAVLVGIGVFMGTAPRQQYVTPSPTEAPICIDMHAAQAEQQSALTDLQASEIAAGHGDLPALLAALHAVASDALSVAYALQADNDQYRIWSDIGEEFAHAADEIEVGHIDAAVTSIAEATNNVHLATAALDSLTTPIC